MSIVRHQPAKILSGAVEANGMVYVAGTIADKRPASVKAQTEEILGRIDALLAQAGSHKSKIVSAQIWLADMRMREEMNQAWLPWVGGRFGNCEAAVVHCSCLRSARARWLRAGTRLARTVGARRRFCRVVA